MRKLTMKLGDGEKYSFSTLTRLQVKAVRSLERDVKTLEQKKLYDELNEKLEEGEITQEEMEKLDELDNNQFNQILNVVRMSMSKFHKEFAPTDDPEKDKHIIEKLDEIIDLRDMSRIASFAVTGTIPKEDEVVVEDKDIDLTK